MIGVNYVSGDNKLTISPLAAGGTLKAIVCYGDQELYESHYPLSHQTAETGNYNMVNTSTWSPALDAAAVVNDVTSFNIASNMGGIKVKVVKTSGIKEVETVIEAPTEGTAPQIICVPGEWEWP